MGLRVATEFISLGVMVTILIFCHSQYIIFYVAMKQPRSTSQTNTKLTKKALLPSFKQSKTQSKIQEFASSNKSQLFIHLKLIPLQILAERKNGEIVKITVNANDAVVQDGSKVNKTTLNIPSSSDLASVRDWVHIDLGEVYSNVKVKKIGDENVFGSSTTMLSWERVENCDKKIGATVSLKEICRSSQRTIESSTSATLNPRQDKNKQMKAFVANLMSRKLNKRSSESGQIEPRISLKKKSEIFKSRHIGEDQLNKNSILIKMNPPSTAGSILAGISGVRSFRRQMLDKNLKESKFTGKSEKQTSIGDQSTFFLNHKANTNIIQLSSIDNEDYDKKKQKFDSQPYFYQKSTITSRFNNNESATKRADSFSRQEESVCQTKKNIDVNPPVASEAEALGQCLKNKSECKSEDEVEQDIKRSGMLESSIKQSESEMKREKKEKKVEQSSECFESKQIQSSGTIFESKYQ